MVKNPLSNAGDMGSIHGRRTKIPHAVGQLSLHTATSEPMYSGARMSQLEGSPCATTRKKPVHCNKDPGCHN